MHRAVCDLALSNARPVFVGRLLGEQWAGAIDVGQNIVPQINLFKMRPFWKNANCAKLEW
jgi:hypothetical protein